MKHRIPHTTSFEGLIELQIQNGNEELRLHKEKCPSNATYLSKVSVAELFGSISHVLDQGLLTEMNSSPFYSIMADECTDIASMVKLSVCGRWLVDGKVVEHF